MNIVAISKEEAKNHPYSSFSSLVSISSREDMATLIDTFEMVQKEYGYLGTNIIDILKTDDNKYIFVCDKSSNSFDFFLEINKLSQKEDLKITPTNAKLKFSRQLSRGYYNRSDYSDEDTTGNVGTEIQGDTSTGFVSSDELLHIRRDSAVRKLLYIAKDDRISINELGVIIGRNSDMSTYIVKDRSVSRKHARVYLKDNRVYVHDFNSSNGTYVDGVRVNSSDDIEIPRGSRLILGTVEFILI